MYGKTDSAIDRCLCSKICHGLKCFDVFGPAVRIPTVVNSICADENMCCLEDLSPSKSKGEKDGVPGGDIGDRDEG